MIGLRKLKSKGPELLNPMQTLQNGNWKKINFLQRSVGGIRSYVDIYLGQTRENFSFADFGKLRKPIRQATNRLHMYECITKKEKNYLKEVVFCRSYFVKFVS